MGYGKQFVELGLQTEAVLQPLTTPLLTPLYLFQWQMLTPPLLLILQELEQEQQFGYLPLAVGGA